MAKKMAAMAPAFPKKRGTKSKKSETKTSVDPGIEGYTPKGAMKGGGSTTAASAKREKQARAKRLAGMSV